MENLVSILIYEEEKKGGEWETGTVSTTRKKPLTHATSFYKPAEKVYLLIIPTTQMKWRPKREGLI